MKVGPSYKRMVLQTLPREHGDRVKRKCKVNEFRFPPKCTLGSGFAASSLLEVLHGSTIRKWNSETE